MDQSREKFETIISQMQSSGTEILLSEEEFQSIVNGDGFSTESTQLLHYNVSEKNQGLVKLLLDLNCNLLEIEDDNVTDGGVTNSSELSSNEMDENCENTFDSGADNENIVETAMDTSESGAGIGNIVETLDTSESGAGIGNIDESIEENEADSNARNMLELNIGLTKKGEERKRKKYVYSLEERKKAKMESRTEYFCLKPSCTDKCYLKCNQNFAPERRCEIHNDYWKLSESKQREFVASSTNVFNVKRRTTKTDSRRRTSYKYMLKDSEGQLRYVCKSFFLATLGYEKKNDRIINYCRIAKEKVELEQEDSVEPVLEESVGQSQEDSVEQISRQSQEDSVEQISRPSSANSSQNGAGMTNQSKSPHNKLDKSEIVKHIESFNPSISHYRREHAPNRRYLPKDLSVTDMHADFKNKHVTPCSYGLYNQVIKEQNIAFVKLGHEQCEVCECFDIHCKEKGHDKNNLQDGCEICTSWGVHKKRSDASRAKYREDAESPCAVGQERFSGDLEKVIMLPRCDMFKSVLFTQRMVAYNESFVPLGKFENSPTKKPVAVIWHEAIQGRKKEDIISTFHKFLLTRQDVRHLVLWMDNCTAQNKNWAFFCYLVYAVNSPLIKTEKITIKYFEPGHTFMSADSFHHQVEQSLTKMKKVYDFDDFKTAVQNANCSRTEVLEMKLADFYEWQDYHSASKINRKKTNVPYLSDIVQVTAVKGNMTLASKVDFDEEDVIVDFLQKKIVDKGFPEPKQLLYPQGFSSKKRDDLIKKLGEGANAIIPPNKLEFWKSIPVYEE